MQATSFHAFALKNSGLDAFLYADVGTELNGSTLTILSVLARLGKDPWEKAVGWVTLPRAAAIDDLSQSIAQMPLAPSVLATSRDIAARALQLLPGKPPQLGMTAQAGGAKQAAAMPQWFTWCFLAVWMLLNLLVTHNPASNGAQNQPSVVVAGSNSAATASRNDAGARSPAASITR